LKLVIDELYTQVIAEQLRVRGHDLVSMHERDDLEGASDEQLLQWAADDRRAIVTENWADFQREMQRSAESGLDHYGVLFTSPRSLPRSNATIGLYVRVLDDFLTRHPTEDGLLNSYCWLPDRVPPE
jgi:hypothetical protein